MDLIAKERDRLLQRTARIYGLSFTIVSLICLSIPGSVNAVAYFIALPLYAIVAVSQFRLGVSRSLLWIGPGILAGIAAIVVIAIVTPGGPGAAGVSAAMQLAAASLASFAIVLTTDTVRRMLLAGAFLVVGSLTALLLEPVHTPLRSVPLLVLWMRLPLANCST